jgi:thiol-disulfide isomerase/thioredoxin
MGRPILLVFSDAACGPCKALMPELVRWQRRHSEKLTFALITRGATKEKLASQPDLKYIFVQNDREVAQQYQALGTPSAVLVSKDGSMGSPLASGAEAIGRLVLAAASGNLPAAPVVRSAPRTMRKVLPIGTPAPQLTLSDLSEKPVSLTDFKGQETMLMFWNPACGFCSRMLPGLKEWEGSRSRTTPRVVLISGGTPEQNRAMGLRSPVLLDQGQGAMGLFGASGTPSALLVDRAGNIASGLAIGADAIFALARNRESTTANKTGAGFRRIEQQLT